MNTRRDLGARAGVCAGIVLAWLTGCNSNPSPASSAAAAPRSSVGAAVRIATDRSGAQPEVVTLPNGMRMRRLDGRDGFNHVVIGRVGADGKRSIACVDSESAAEAFLTGAGTGATGAGQ